jgi:hypothetical protein
MSHEDLEGRQVPVAVSYQHSTLAESRTGNMNKATFNLRLVSFVVAYRIRTVTCCTVPWFELYRDTSEISQYSDRVGVTIAQCNASEFPLCLGIKRIVLGQNTVRIVGTLKVMLHAIQSLEGRSQQCGTRSTHEVVPKLSIDRSQFEYESACR